jgi:translocation and assembly module TamB
MRFKFEIMNKFLKISLWTLSGVVSLIIILIILTQTSFFKSWLSGTISSVLSESLSAEVSIGQLEGNLFNHLEIREVQIIDHADTIISISGISADYRLLPLLNEQIILENLEIEKPVISLNQEIDGRWNISQLFSSDSVSVVDSINTDSSKFDYSIELKKLSIKNGFITVQSPETLIPSEISDIHIDLSGAYQSNNVHVKLDSFGLEAIDPDLSLERLAFDFRMDEESVELKDFELHTSRNVITASGDYQDKNERAGTLQLVASELDLTDLHILLPDIIVKSKRDLKFSAKIKQDSVALDLNFETDNQSLSVGLFSTNRTKIFNNLEVKGVEFVSKIELKNFILGNWLNLDLPVRIASGRIDVNGWYKDLGTHKLKIMGRLKDVKYHNYSLESFDLQAELKDGDLNSTILSNSKNGRFNIQSQIDKAFTDPKIFAQVSIRNLNLRNIFSSKNMLPSQVESVNGQLSEIETDLNLDVQFTYADSIGVDEYSYIDFRMFDSRFDDYIIDEFKSHFQFRDSLYILDSLSLQTQFAELLLTGSGNFTGFNNLNYIIRTRDIGTLGTLLNMDSLNADGNIYGSLRGELSSLTNRIHVDLKDVQYNTILLDSLTGEAETIFKNDKLLWDGNAVLTGITVDSQHIQDIRVKSIYDGMIISSEIKFYYTRDIYGSLTANIVPDSSMKIDLPQIDFTFRQENWSGSLQNLIFNPVLQTLDLEDFNLVCLNSEHNCRINAQGRLSMNGYQRFSTRINDIDLNMILQTFGINEEIGGKINLDLDLSGTLQKPVFEGNIFVEDGIVRNLEIRKFYCAYEYNDDQLLLNLALDFNETDSLAVNGSLPLHISMTDTLPLFNEEAGFEVTIKSTPIPLSVLVATDYNFEALEGKLICDLSVGNTLANPSFNGNILINDGLMKIPYWGIDYQNINVDLSAEKDRFILKKFEVSRDAGTLNASGAMQIDFAGEKESIISSDLKLVADKFFIVQHKDFEFQISSELQYTDEEDGPRIGGDVEILRSNFYLPAVLDRLGGVSKGSENAKPLLVKAREAQMEVNAGESDPALKLIVKDTLKAPEFLDLLNGDIEVKLNRNTWIRNPQLRVELEGNLKVGFSEGHFSLLGPVRTVRGQYDVLGRRFVVVEGLVEFQGRKNVKIPIKLEAQYEYRTTGRERRYLVLKVSGDLNNPIIKFYEDLSELSQDDAISILLYGRKKDELNYNNQSELASTRLENTVAMGLVSNYLSDRVSRSVGDNLKLDVIEVNATDNWKSANFIIGKYITNNLFVTYKREFGQTDDNDIAPETITLEYEIWKQIYLQLIEGHPRESGVDLFFKIDLD